MGIKGLNTFVIYACFMCLISAVLASPSLAENEQSIITSEMQVIDSSTLISPNAKISLWGVKGYDASVLLLEMRFRELLEDKIAEQAVTCYSHEEFVGDVHAQCLNYLEEDLALYLLNQGAATADRQEIYGTSYEIPYIKAEKRAQSAKLGIWSEDYSQAVKGGEAQSRNFLMSVLVLMGVFVLALSVLIFFVLRSFRSVVDVQNSTIDLAEREKVIKEREKMIMAAMINSEISENKTKIEAYLVLYEETLRDLETARPKYQDTGDLIQKQPALSRSVFDGNTHKVDLFGGPLASEIIHYYARIKSTTDYVDIKPEAEKSEVLDVVETALSKARKLDEISQSLMTKISQYGLLK